MRLRLVVLLISGAFAVQASAEHATAEHEHSGHSAHEKSANKIWTQLPVLDELPLGNRNRAVFSLKNIKTENVTVYPPVGSGGFPDKYSIRGSAKPYKPDLHHESFEVTPTGRGNYFWVSARSQSEQNIVVANSVRYFSSPGPAPTQMLKQSKSELEIIPQPLPREHWQYREGETWRFKIQYQEQALANTPLVFENEQGAKMNLLSDANGVVSLTFPNDVPKNVRNSHGGHHERPKVKFVLAAQHMDEASKHHYLTTFNFTYSVAPLEGKSLVAGIGFMAFGGLLATPLLFRGKKANKNAGGKINA